VNTLQKFFIKLQRAFKSGGFSGFTLKVINFALSRIFFTEIHFTSVIGRKQALEVFKGRELKKTSKGYSFVDPMPSEIELKKYYSNTYWESRLGKNLGANSRDFVHFHLLKNTIPEFFSDSRKCILNFGAGHGGISNLFWFEGFEVINIEPSGLPNLYDKRWKTYPSISDVSENSIDLIYGSHSLEHVQNIDKFKSHVHHILKPDSFLFWEVPNAIHPKCGAMKGLIDIPHTYYFTTNFFDDWFDDVILNNAFDQTHSRGIIERWNESQNREGSVIRALGKIS
jgi:SAM-dependent methyltransferase